MTTNTSRPSDKTGQATNQTAAPRQTILVVDDEADILESIKQLFDLSIPNVRVLTAESGPAGLALLKKEAVDLIVSDYKMPGMNGLQFLSEARTMFPRVPRVLVTAFPDLDLAIKAVNDAKIENFFTKPVDPKKVVDVVKDVLGQRRAQTLRDQSFARSLDVLRRKVEKE